MNASPAAASASITLPPPPNFDLLARPYRLLEALTFGRALHRARTCFLPALGGCRRALILGDGDGRFTAALLAHNPNIFIDAVDLSPAMLRVLTRRAHAAHITAPARLRTHCANALAFTPPPLTTYDLVVTHFFLDCLTTHEIRQLCHNLAPSLHSSTTWLVSDFRIPAGPLRLPARAFIRSLYLAFRLLTGLRVTSLPDYPAPLSTAGFVRTAQRLSVAGILTSELWQRAEPVSASHPGRSTLPTMLKPPIATHHHHPSDPVPDPEPASPSLPEPDPGVFHHDPNPPPPPTPNRPG